MSISLALGIFILRVALGLIIAAHGSQKLFGWFGGNGLAKTISWLQAQGFKPAWFWTLLALVGEIGGGLLLVLGFLTPLAAMGIFASMLMAVLRFHWSNGFWAAKRGYEYPLFLLIVSLVLGLIGPGGYALDALIGFTLPVAFYIAGLVLSIIVVGIGILTSRQQAVQQPAT